jgi:hypothetical protein
VSGGTLTVGNNVVLQGKAANTNALVTVTTGGTLNLQGDAKITGNTNTNQIIAGLAGSGVYALGDDVRRVTITLSGNAEISGNTQMSDESAGSGVYLSDYADLTMSGSARITNNTAKSTNFSTYGGGVCIAGRSTFTMEGGEISGNTASSTTRFASGGGVYVGSGNSFFFKGGVISGNTLEYVTFGQGGGVYNEGTFVMSGAAVVTPNSSGSYTSTQDDRNAVYVAASKSVAVYSSLTAGTAGLIDLPSTWDAEKVLKSAANATATTAQISEYASGAPTDKFTLGKFIKTTDDYAVTDIGDSKQWDAGGTGGLEDTP